MELGGVPVRLADCRLLEAWDYRILLAAPQSTQAVIDFLSPTVVKKGGKELPFPDLEGLVSSLRVRWNAFAPNDPVVASDSALGMRLGRFLVRSHLVRFHRFPTVGFTGFVELTLPKEAEAALWSATLLRFARWAGVGHRTAMGMGSVRVNWKTPGQER